MNNDVGDGVSVNYTTEFYKVAVDKVVPLSRVMVLTTMSELSKIRKLKIVTLFLSVL